MKLLVISCNTGNYDNYHVLKLPNKEKFNWYYYSYKLNITGIILILMILIYN